MIFKKKQGMIDIRKLQRRGVVRIPRQDIIIPTDKNGFVELETNSKSMTPATSAKTSSNLNFFGLGNRLSSTTAVSSTSKSDSYNKQGVDVKMSELDNKIYKLEQRIELLEQKLDVNQSSESNVGIMGW